MQKPTSTLIILCQEEKLKFILGAGGGACLGLPPPRPGPVPASPQHHCSRETSRPRGINLVEGLHVYNLLITGLHVYILFITGFHVYILLITKLNVYILLITTFHVYILLITRLHVYILLTTGLQVYS